MTREEYLNQIKADILENYGDEIMKGASREEIEEKAWIDDGVTGNASGSYTFSRSEAKENIDGAEDVIRDLVQDYAIDSDTVAEKFLYEDWEYFDVSIRCYLLDEAIDMAFEDIESLEDFKEEQQPQQQ